jgi:hypothetical protein
MAHRFRITWRGFRAAPFLFKETFALQQAMSLYRNMIAGLEGAKRTSGLPKSKQNPRSAAMARPSKTKMPRLRRKSANGPRPNVHFAMSSMHRRCGQASPNPIK